MSQVTIVQVIYNSRKFIKPVFSAIFEQTFKDFNVAAVISGNEDGGKEFLKEKFPQVEIFDPGYNIGFAAGHNLVFEKYQSDFFQLVNPDFVMQPDYMEKMLSAFNDPRVGAATGRLYHLDADVIASSGFPISNRWANAKGQMPDVLDTTGLVFSKSGRVRDRGQHETDLGQYNSDTLVAGVCAAGAMYRRTAIESVKEPTGYFDSDFHTTYEDVDLSWRLANRGWKNIFVPDAIGYHARGAAGTIGGYKKVFSFIKYHKKLNPLIRQLSFRNHIFTYVKNSPYFYPQFFVREFFMFLYILLFEPGTLKILPSMIKLLPKMWRKRKSAQGLILAGNLA
ncbi:MAG: glycosyltransferase family 2 protein [Candidatus Doudnabacteria bacterium]|nr:glycosyltransferase family 2 protein [Candidatus Doudnabacteria bacterium]